MFLRFFCCKSRRNREDYEYQPVSTEDQLPLEDKILADVKIQVNNQAPPLSSEELVPRLTEIKAIPHRKIRHWDLISQLLGLGVFIGAGFLGKLTYGKKIAYEKALDQFNHDPLFNFDNLTCSQGISYQCVDGGRFNYFNTFLHNLPQVCESLVREICENHAKEWAIGFASFCLIISGFILIYQPIELRKSLGLCIDPLSSLKKEDRNFLSKNQFFPTNRTFTFEEFIAHIDHCIEVILFRDAAIRDEGKTLGDLITQGSTLSGPGSIIAEYHTPEEREVFERAVTYRR